MKLLALAMGLSCAVFASDSHNLFLEDCKRFTDGNGVVTSEGSLPKVETCRLFEGGKLVSVYFPEQTVFMRAGDADMFEREIMMWGRK